MRIIIAGGRDFHDYRELCRRVDILVEHCVENLGEEKIEIVSGAAKGADRLGMKYAKERGYDCMTFPAEWDKFGKSAGYRRNVQMADYADMLFAFWDGKSKGT